MACTRYVVSLGGDALQSSVSISYIDCNEASAIITVSRGNSIEFCAESVDFISISQLFPSLNVTEIGPCVENDTPSVGLFYELKACTGTFTNAYTTVPPNPLISNQAVLVGTTNTYWTYTGQSVQLLPRTATLITNLTATQRSGCPDQPPNLGSFFPILLGYEDTGRSSIDCFRFNNGTLPGRQFYINSTSLQGATFIAVDPTGLNVAPDGVYTDGTYYIEIRNGIIGPATLCQRIPETRYYELIACDNQQEKAYTTRPSNLPQGVQALPGQGQRVTIGNRVWVYNGAETTNLPPNSVIYQETDITPTNSAGCTTPGGRLLYEIAPCPDSTSQVTIYTEVPPTQVRERDQIIYQGNKYSYTGRLVQPSGRFVEVFRSQIEFTNRVACDTPEAETLFLLTPCNTTQQPKYTLVPNTVNNAQVEIDSFLFYYNGIVRKPTGRFDLVLPNRITVTGRLRCEIEEDGGGDTGGGGEEVQTTVIRRLESIVSPSLQSIFREKCANQPFNINQFKPGSIKVNGQVVGEGQVNYTFTIGQEYVVEFDTPSHPFFTFSGGNTVVRFTATTDNSPIQAIFTPTFIPNTATVNITTSYSPNLSPSTGKGEIFISKRGKVGVGQVLNLELEEGTYTISFGPIEVLGMVYVTPPPQTITIKKADLCKTLNINGLYTGVPLPKGYWLKTIDGSEKATYITETIKGIFSNDIANLTTVFTGSFNTEIDKHYTHVYHELSGSATASIQFSIGYGHFNGSGSNDQGGQYNDTPTRAIYGQYRSIITEGARKIELTGNNTDHFYVINYQKSRKDIDLDVKAFEINLAHLSGSEFINGVGSMATHTGSNVQLGGLGKVLRLTTDYKINSEPDVNPLSYNIVSGSIEDGIYSENNPHYYGKIYPKSGFVLLDANKLDISASFGTVTTREVEGLNQLKLFTAISGAAQLTDISGDFLGMKARTVKQEKVQYYFINVRSKEFNLSNNTTFFDTTGLEFTKYGIPPNVRISSDLLQNTGNIIKDFEKNPKTFITTIGLYNANRELLAVAKISTPDIKSFTEEVMYTVRIKR